VLLKLICEPEVTMVTVQETLPVAEQLFPGRPAPDGTEDARWQPSSRLRCSPSANPKSSGRSF
jgi:hypothetical protein